MLKNLKIFLLLSFSAALLVGCGGSNPLVDDAENNIKLQNYDAALTAAENLISEEPQNPLGYYYKGEVMAEKARVQNSAQAAKPFYEDMQMAFDEAKAKAANVEETPSQINNISNILDGVWRYEYNQGVNLATNDSLMQATQNPLDQSISHMQNAVMLQPDSANNWQVIAQVNNMKQDYANAAEAQKEFIELKPNPAAEDYVVLSQYYQLSEQPEKAIGQLETANGKYPENITIIESLADAYSRSGQSQKAIELVESLVEEDPSNPQYRLALGTQIYQSAQSKQEQYDENIDEIFDLRQEVKSASGNEADELQGQIDETLAENEALLQDINGLTEQAVEELEATLENRPDDPKAYNTLGIIYQNKASVLFDKRNMTRDNEMAAELDSQAKDELRKSMGNYEKAAELDPENSGYWRSLFQIYATLGMDEKAAEAEEKAGMNQ